MTSVTKIGTTFFSMKSYSVPTCWRLGTSSVNRTVTVAPRTLAPRTSASVQERPLSIAASSRSTATR